MLKLIEVAVVACVAVVSCPAQNGLLTLADAKQIIEQLPAFRDSYMRGECPGIDAAEGERAGTFSLQVRGSCPREGFIGSMLVGNFIVDARTGDVMTWPNGERLPVPDGVKQFATKLVAQAQTRVLSRQEAQCVAWLTARETGGSTAPADVERLDLTDGELRFSVRYPLVQPSANAVIYFLMDWPPFAVVTSSDRRPIHSVELDGLLSQIRTAHGEVALSPLESVEVALRVPRIVEPVSSKCPPLVFADSGTSRLRFVGVEDACEHLPRSRRLIAAVDVLTGAVTDPRDQRVLDTPESIELARELLSRAGERRAAAKEETERVCRAR